MHAKIHLDVGSSTLPAIEYMSPLILANVTKRREWQMLLSKSSKCLSTLLNTKSLKISVVEIVADDLFERLSDYDYERAYRWRRDRKLKNTTSWILKQSDVLAWLRGEGLQCLWLSGIGELRLSVYF